MALVNKKTNSNEELQAAEDSGFGKKFVGSSRLINSDGSFNMDRVGAMHSSVYEHMIYVSWTRFFSITILGFIFINALFALVYSIYGIESLHGKSISPIQDFLNCFYFSIQTFTSVGYGFLNPQCNFTNIIASINAFIGLITFALATGLLFSRFSKARVNILFSDNMLIAPFNTGKSLQFRLVNANNNTLMNMEISANITWLEEVDGVMRRKFDRLKFELDFIRLFPLNWTVVHVIDDSSPLWGKSKEDLIENNSEILIMLKGYDDTYNQSIYKNTSYHTKDILEGYIFEPMYTNQSDKTILHIDRLNNVKKVD